VEKIITIQEVVWPAQGKKQGHVTDTEGNRWYVFADKIGQFKQGAAIKIKDTSSSDFQGRTYTTLKAWEVVSGGQSIRIPAGGGAEIPRQQMQAVSQHTMDHERRMDIFCCGAVNAILGHPSIDPLTFVGRPLVDVVNNLKAVWKMTLGPDAPKAPVERGAGDEFFNDQIPFGPEMR